MNTKDTQLINTVVNLADSMIQVLAVADDLITDEEQRDYCKQVEKVILRNEKGIFGGFESCMRSGKTHMAINHHIPFLLNNSNLKVAILTAPLSGIVEDNSVKLQVMCNKHGFMFVEKPSDVYDILDEVPDAKVVLYLTNAMAWVSKQAREMYDFIGKKNIGVFVDEAQVWTLDHWSNTRDVMGYEGNQTLKSVLYKTIKDITKASGHTYALSATPNPQFLGNVSTIEGEIQYKVVVVGSPAKKIAHRLGWIGDVHYHSNGSTLVGLNENDAFQMMLDSMMKIETETGYKRAAMIECNRKTPHSENPEDFPVSYMKRKIIESNYNLPQLTDDDFIGALMVSSNSLIKAHFFNKNGEMKEIVSEKLVYKKLEDQEDPLRFLLVIDMAKMGTTLPTVKEFFSVRETDLNDNKKAPITHQARQKLGRPATPYCGVPLKIFYKEFAGHLGNVKNFDPRINTYNWYLVENIMNKAAVEEMKEFYPSYADFVALNGNYCSTCGRTCSCPSKHEEQVNKDELRKVLGV